ncbi:MAG: glucose-6-phosphate isomerase [Oscillospiraceae bacterium]|nr:glucose-6-phosphate isomerase [Oscillospiraceae bacterium]
MPIKFITKYTRNFVSDRELSTASQEVREACGLIRSGRGAGSDYLGWRDLPFDYDKAEFARIKAAAARIRQTSDALVVIGIGGSYLGARAVTELLSGGFLNETSPLKVYFAGNSISGDYLNHILKLCEGKRLSVNVISKSGTTTEPAIAFRVFKQLLEERYGKAEAARRIYATTDRAKGTLKQLADREGYETFVVPDDVGGRYSVLTAVGLLPIAAAGFDIDALMAGAAASARKYDSEGMENDCNVYAALRNIFYRKGKTCELMACYEPAFALFNEWYKQLFGESEGKDKKGLMPTSVIFSTDLHSMGQFVQDGARVMFETVVQFKKTLSDRTVEAAAEDFDGLNYLAGKSMSEINDAACDATILAHNEGGVPCLVIEADAIDEFNVGELIYFFERVCAVSGYMLGINPFNQPGVESYKKNMFALLGKPGYEGDRQALLSKLK